MVGIIPMDITQDESIRDIIYQVDTVLQVIRFLNQDESCYSMMNMLDQEISIMI